jgi:LAS superfamily LD-carboxypeptidase LdcB
MDLKRIIRKVIKEAHEKRQINEATWVPKNTGSKYGMRLHPVQKVYKLHAGQDYPEPQGTAIIVIKPGKVLRSEFGKANGNFVEILHNDGSVTMYLHLSKRMVSAGDIVNSGKVIGLVGSTGLSTGPHLHFVYKKDGKMINPETYAPQVFRFSNSSSPDVSEFVKPVAKGKTKEYMVYAISSGKVHNPTGNYIGSLGTLISKRNGEPIYGSQRKRDGRIFLFTFDNSNDVLYIEMSNEDFLNYDVKKQRIEGTWEKLTETSVVRDSKSKNQEKSSETKNKETQKSGDLKDDRLSEPILKAINDLIKKGVNITKKNIDKEFEQEGSTRPDLGKNKIAEKKILELINDCNKKFGISGGVVSGYRSYDDQVNNFAKKVLNNKRTIDNVQASNTLPGFSQHHTGKAFDIYSTETSWWDAKPKIKKWVADNAKDYGFEITYKTQGPLRVAEPWHLNYIG